MPHSTNCIASLSLDEAVAKHSKLFVFALLLSLPPGIHASPGNDHAIQRFADTLAAHLHGKRLDPSITHSRTGPNQFAVAVLANGHKTQSVSGHLAVATGIWARVLGIQYAHGLVVPCPQADGRTGVMIRKDQPGWEGDLAYCRDWLARVLGRTAV
jgi:hypothetical protein